MTSTFLRGEMSDYLSFIELQRFVIFQGGWLHVVIDKGQKKKLNKDFQIQGSCFEKKKRDINILKYNNKLLNLLRKEKGRIQKQDQKVDY